MYCCRRSTRSGFAIELTDNDAGGPQQVITDCKTLLHDGDNDVVLRRVVDDPRRDRVMASSVEAFAERGDSGDTERLKLCQELIPHERDAAKQRVVVRVRGVARQREGAIEVVDHLE